MIRAGRGHADRERSAAAAGEHGRRTMTVHDLEPGATYEVIAEIVDHTGQRIGPGRRLTFRSRAFLPYHGGHTIVFDEVTLYLHEEEHAALLGRLEDYLRR